MFKCYYNYNLYKLINSVFSHVDIYILLSKLLIYLKSIIYFGINTLFTYCMFCLKLIIHYLVQKCIAPVQNFVNYLFYLLAKLYTIPWL